jgi:hypothetical protein
MEEPAVRLLRQTACAVGKSVALFAALGIVLLWITGTAGAQPAAGTQNEAQKQLSDLTTSLANGTVATVDILHLPDGMETRASVSPEKMDKWWQYRITISKVTEWGGRDAIVEVMRSTTVAPIPRMPDLRSAVIFSDSHGNKIGTLYFGRYFGSYIGQFGGAEGSIGGTPVSFKGALSSWLKDMIPSKLR